MKFSAFITSILLISSLGFAVPKFTWYSIDSYTCQMTNAVEVSYSSKDANKVVGRYAGAPLQDYYPDGDKYDHNTNTSHIGFTGHRPSAGPPYNPLESSYSIRIKGLLQAGLNDIDGVLFVNTAFAGWVKTVYTAKCKILVNK